jgi:hypothetical protein
MSRVTLAGATQQDRRLNTEYQRRPDCASNTVRLRNRECSHVPALNQ